MTRPENDPLAEVRTTEDRGRPALVFVRTLRHPPEKVWAALTDPAQLRAWAPFDASAALDRLGPVTLAMVDGEQTVELPGAVLRAERPRLLEYTWGDDVLRWKLEPCEGGTRLTLRHTVESPDWFSRTAAGWHLCLAVAERMLDGRPVARVVGGAALAHGWEALERAYAGALGVR